MEIKFLVKIFCLTLITNGNAQIGDQGTETPPSENSTPQMETNSEPPPAEVGDDKLPSGNVDGSIDITALQCLCNLQINANTDGNVEASADGNGDNCGFDPLPKISINCEGILNGSVTGGYFYEVGGDRDLMGTFGGLSINVGDGYGPAPVLWRTDMTTEYPFRMQRAEIQYGSRLQNIVWAASEKSLNKTNLCTNEFSPGTYEYIVVDISIKMLTENRGCPIKEGERTEIPYLLESTIYQFPEMLPCSKLSWDVEVYSTKGGRMALEIWYNFEVKKNCKPIM